MLMTSNSKFLKLKFLENYSFIMFLKKYLISFIKLNASLKNYAFEFLRNYHYIKTHRLYSHSKVSNYRKDGKCGANG